MADLLTLASTAVSAEALVIGSSTVRRVLRRACLPTPADRFASVAELAEAWAAGRR